MRYLIRILGALACLSLIGTLAPAHFSMLLSETASARRLQEMTVLYQWGHPFEHQLFATPEPVRLSVLSPQGKRTDLRSRLEKVTQPVVSYRFRFNPDERGDYLFLLEGPPIWMEEDQEFLQDNVKLVLHVQAQKGWDRAAGETFELVPLTRPYGLQPGMVFQTQALIEGKPLGGALVEVERYNPVAPRELPADEQITRTARTDPNGVVTCTLLEPGWWCISAQRVHGRREQAGKSCPIRQRAILWVFVDESGTPKVSR
jgi:cobalt/nickel transport protein